MKVTIFRADLLGTCIFLVSLSLAAISGNFSFVIGGICALLVLMLVMLLWIVK